MVASVSFGSTGLGVIDRRTHLVGRTSELRALSSALKAVHDDGVARTVSLIGAAGIGKTRLVRDFLSNEHDSYPSGAAVRVFRGSAREGGFAYEVFARVLRARFGIVEGTAEDAAKALVRAHVAKVLEDRKVGDVCFFLGQLMDLEFEDSPLIRAVRTDSFQMRLLQRAVVKRFFEADARATSGSAGADTQGTLVLVFDDLHQAHDDSLDLLAFLIDNVDAPLLILCMARPEMVARHEWGRAGAALGPLEGAGPPSARHTVLEVSALSESAAAMVVRELLAPCGDADVDELVVGACTLGGGNPALLERMIRIFHDMGVLETEDAFAEVESWRVHAERIEKARLPLTIEDAVQARIAALTSRERDVLERAAIMGSVFWLGGLVATVRIDAPKPDVWLPDEAPDEAVLRALLRELCDRDYVLRLPDSAFADDEEFAFKHNLERETLLRLLPKAQTKRFHEAIANWLSFHPTVGLHEESMGQLAHHERLAGRHVHAVTAYFEAGRLARDRYATARAADYYGKGLELASDGAEIASRELLTALHHYGDVLSVLGSHAAALGAFKDLLALAFTLNLPAKGGVAHSRMGRLFRDAGQLTEAQTHLEAALALFERAKDDRGVASTVDDLGRLFRLRGDYERALSSAESALAMRRILGDKRSIALSLNNLGLVHRDAGRLDPAVHAFDQALALRREIGDLVGVSISLVDLGVVAQDRGDDARAKVLFAEALEVARETGDRHRWASALTRLGETAARLADPEEALSYLRQAEAIASELDDRVALGQAVRALGKAYLARGDHANARSSAQRAIDTFVQLESYVELAISHRVLGEILAVSSTDADDLLKARAQLLQAIWTLDEAGHGLEFARSCAVYATLLRTSGDDDPKTLLEADQFERRAAAIFVRAKSSS